MTLLAFAAERRAAAAPAVQQSMDVCCLPAGPTAANPPHAAAAVDRWDRQTDGRTPYRYTDSATCYVSTVNNGHKCILNSYTSHFIQLFQFAKLFEFDNKPVGQSPGSGKLVHNHGGPHVGANGVS